MRITLNEAEQEALLDCSLEARALYVFGLRPQMDVSTGLVGVSSRVSYGGLALAIQFQPARGSRRDAWKASKPQMINLVDELVRVGLAKRYSRQDKDDKQLSILLVLADRALARPDFEGHMRGTPGESQQGRASAGFATGEGHSKKQDDGHISEYQRKPPVLSSVAGTSESIGVAAAPLSREIEVVKLLFGLGVSVTPAMVRKPEYAAALRQPDADWLAAVETARIRKGAGALHANYLLPILADMRMPSSRKAVRQGDGRGQRQSFNPAAALRKVMHEEVGDGGRTFDA